MIQFASAKAASLRDDIGLDYQTARRVIAIALAAGVILAALSPPLGLRNVDFEKAYYPVARSVLEKGTFAYTYEGFKNLPIVAVLLVPFALVGPEAAAWLFAAFGLACGALALWLLGRLACRSPSDWALLGLLFACDRHLYTSLRLGQLTPLCLLLVVGVAVARERRRPWLAGVLLALAFVLKIPAGVVLLLFLYRGELRSVAGAGLAYLGIVAVSLLAFGLPLHGDYLEFVVLQPLGATLTAHNDTSLAAAIERWLRPGGLFDWRMVAMPGWLSALAAGLAALLYLAAWRVTSPRLGADPVEGRLELSMALCLSLLTFPVTWDHYHLLLLPAFAFSMWALASAPSRARLATWLVALGLSNLPVLWIIGRPGDALRPPGLRSLVPSAPLLGCLVLLGLLMRQYVAVRRARVRPSAEGALLPYER